MCSSDLRNAINELLAEKTGQPLEKITADSMRTKYLEPDQAVSYGLIDKVLRSENDLPQKPTFLGQL